MLKPPDKMVSETQVLTATIRSSNFDRSACRYGEFVRDNVMGLLTNTYPLFCRQLPSEQLNALIEEFIDVHHATEPQFHHIATEFAKFIQQRTQQSDVEHSVDVAYNPKSLSSNEVALLEYEWAALSVEVDTVILPNFFKWRFEENEWSGFAVELNPSIHLLALPFIVHSESVTFLTHKRDHVYYALYRDSHQQVMTLALQESALLAIPLPWIACEAGWFVAEFGRQPWAIGEVLPVNMAASNLPASSIWLSLAAVYILYTLFLIIEMYLLVKFAKRGPSALKTGRLSSCQLFLFTPYGVIAKCLDA